MAKFGMALATTAVAAFGLVACMPAESEYSEPVQADYRVFPVHSGDIEARVVESLYQDCDLTAPVSVIFADAGYSSTAFSREGLTVQHALNLALVGRSVTAYDESMQRLAYFEVAYVSARMNESGERIRIVPIHNYSCAGAAERSSVPSLGH
tara:strand:- start:1848 stop:2303 length:456 start_codon:yes stop_codon:yes gene_type:complete